MSDDDESIAMDGNGEQCQSAISKGNESVIKRATRTLLDKKKLSSGKDDRSFTQSPVTIVATDI